MRNNAKCKIKNAKGKMMRSLLFVFHFAFYLFIAILIRVRLAFRVHAESVLAKTA